MFCPHCGAEYEKDKAECPACHTPFKKKSTSNLKKPQKIKFITVYQAGDPTFLVFAKSVLQSEGIPYYFKGEGLQDLEGAGRLGTGFNPLFGPVEIQVDEKDAERAKDILEQIEQGKVDEPANEEANEVSEENKYSDVSKEKKSRKGIVTGIIIGISISIVTFYIFKAVQDYRKKQSNWYEYGDLNHDGKNDAFYYYEKGLLTRIEEDRNFDGKIDNISHFKANVIDYCLADENYDGVFEIKYFYKKGILHRADSDYNNDKNVDVVANYIDGILYDSIHYHESTGKIWKKIYYRYGVINEEQIDQDYDGIFDIIVQYNEVERPVKTTHLKK